MFKTISPLSKNKPAAWDKHCLLVLQFPISLQSEIRLSARIDGVKLELRSMRDRSAPHRPRDIFKHPSTFSFPMIKNAQA